MIRALGRGREINTFKSFPDLEVAEYLVRHRPTGRTRGVQVKVITIADAEGYGTVNFHAPSFTPSAVTDVLVLTYRSDLDDFAEPAWIIPAADIPTLARRSGHLMEMSLHPAGGSGSRYDRYRVRRTDLDAELTRRLRSTG